MMKPNPGCHAVEGGGNIEIAVAVAAAAVPNSVESAAAGVITRFVHTQSLQYQLSGTLQSLLPLEMRMLCIPFLSICMNLHPKNFNLLKQPHLKIIIKRDGFN